MQSPPRRPRTGGRLRPPAPADEAALAAVAAHLDAQITRGTAHGIRLWWLCVGVPQQAAFAVEAFGITTDPAGGIEAVGAYYAQHPPVRPSAAILVSAVQLDGLDDDTLAAVVTLPRERFYPVVPPGLSATVPGAAPETARVQAALVADIARAEPGWPDGSRGCPSQPTAGDGGATRKETDR